MDGMELKLARVKLGLSLWELGKAANVRPERISEMETNKRSVSQAIIDTLEALSK